MQDFIPLFFLLVFVGFIIFMTHRENKARQRLQRLRPRNALFVDSTYNTTRITVTSPSQSTSRWRTAYLFVTNKQIVAYLKHSSDDTPLFACAPHQIEGFWRPTKYEPGTNLIELHANIDDRWTILQAYLTRARMMALVRALKEIVSEDMVRAYRQRRPYIYRPPTPAQSATQNIHGAWELTAPFRLYLMPSSLVFLGENDEVERIIPLRYVQNIAALRRLDADSEGLVRFTLTSTGELVALALKDYEAWAQAIAIAARRTLEEPIVRKQKKHQDDDDDVSDEVEDATGFDPSDLLQVGDWHDGEIIQWQPSSQANTRLNQGHS